MSGVITRPDSDEMTTRYHGGQDSPVHSAATRPDGPADTALTDPPRIRASEAARSAAAASVAAGPAPPAGAVSSDSKDGQARISRRSG